MRTMNAYTIGCLVVGMTFTSVIAGEASTSANAGTIWGRPGTANATANWIGGNDGQGFARTDTRSGAVNLARGVAFGVDRDGMDLSFSHAIAPQHGPAYAGTFNLSIGTDGRVTGSYGGAVAQGGLSRNVQAGGTAASNGRPAVAQASGNTWPGGTVQASTRSYNTRPTPYRVIQHRPVPARGYLR